MDSLNFNKQDLQHQEKMILALKDVILAVTGSFDLDTLLQRIVESCIKFSDSSRGSLFLYNENNEKLVMRAEKNNAPELRFNASYEVNVVGKENIGLTTYVFKTGEALAFNSREEIVKHPAHLGKFNKDSSGEIDCQSLICIPLKGPNKKPIGVLKMENTLDRRNPKIFSDSDILDFQFFADIVSEAITNFNNQAVKIDTSINTILSNALESSKPGNLTERLRKIAATFKSISNAVGVSVWLIEGSKLICKGAVGHNYKKLEENSYDLLSIDINKAKGVGLTPWIAKSGEILNIKTHQEIISHPQYKGTYDNVLYPGGQEKCESFIGAPLKTGDRIIGVIKADSRIADKQHPEKYFTTEEEQIFSYLSIITSIIVESEQEFQRTDNHNRQLVALYKLGTECYELNSSEAIFWYLLVGLTHGEGIGFNRTNLFKLTDDKTQAYLTGLIGLGPRNKMEGSSIHRRFDEGDKLNIDECKLLFFDKDTPPSSILQTFIEGKKISLSDECFLRSFINETLLQKRSHVKLISIEQCCEDVSNLFGKLETASNNFLAFSLLDADDEIFIGFCDNVYSEQTSYNAFSISAVDTFISQISLALSRLSLKKSKEETTEEAWREFTAITAHRIGTETSIMSGALSFLKDSLPKHSESHMWQEDLSALENSLDNLKKAVREHTELQKPPEIKRKKIKISEILDDVKEDIDILQCNRVHKVTITNNYSRDLPIVYGDSDSLMYVFKELYENAIKEMPKGGELNISSLVVSISDLKYLQIKISDTGTGIRTESLPKIFDRGFRDRKGGTGLGLYIVKRNIELHEGTITVENNKNRGASFFVNIPIAKFALNRIMIVEDTEIQLKQLVRSIKRMYPKLYIDAVENENKAIQLLKTTRDSNEYQYDFIIADVNLEEGGGSKFGGISILEYVRENNIKVKVIIITAHKGTTYREPSGIEKGILDKAKELEAFACISRNQSANYLDDLNKIINV
jgi:nitrogen-specific signal transduction histidine kinase/transcriptional regulator with GAF, ATPase, and Fis domain